MAERQAAHRQGLEAGVVRSNILGERIGQVLGFVLAAGTIALGWDLIRAGKETIGLTSILGALVALVTVFVVGRKKRGKELDDKNR